MLQKKYTATLQIIALTAGAVWSGACVTQQQGEQIKNDVFSLETRLDEMQSQMHLKTGDFQGQANRTQKGLASMSAQIASWERELQLLAGQVDMLRQALGTTDLSDFTQEGLPALQQLKTLNQDLYALKTSLEEFWQKRLPQLKDDIEAPLIERIQRLEKRMQALEKKREKKHITQKTSATNTLTSLKAAREAHSKKQWQSLKQHIPALMPKMTKASSKEELNFYYAEALFRLGELPEAAAAFDQYLKLPSSNDLLRQRRAKLMLGHIFRLSADLETARIYYLEVRTEFPGTEQAQVADAELQKLATP